MSQANIQHTTTTPPATLLLAEPVLFDDDDCRYVLQIGAERITVDPSKKGEPGDLVVVWRKKHCPVVVQRLARCEPWNTYYFLALDTGRGWVIGADRRG